MHLRGIHHLGVAVDDLEEALNTYRTLFAAEVEGRETAEDLGVEAAAVRIGDSTVELLGSLGPETYVGKFLARRGPGMHHVAYEVENLRAELERLAAEGAELVDSEPRAGLFGLEVAFIHPHAAHGVLAELVSRG